MTCAVLASGALTMGVLPLAEPRLVLLSTLIIIGGAIFPDMDHHSAGPARSFGLLTKTIAVTITVASKVAYVSTRSSTDARSRRAHRTLTHSALGCVLFGAGFGLLFAIPTPAGPVPAAVASGLLSGMGIYAALAPPTQWKTDGKAREPKSRVKPKRRKKRGKLEKLLRKWWPKRNDWKWIAALVGAGFVLITPNVASGWWPYWLGCSLTIGMMVHCAGDAMTDVGIPWAWPLVDERGKRWGHRWLLPASLRFTTEHGGEAVANGVMSVGTVGLVGLLLYASAAV